MSDDFMTDSTREEPPRGKSGAPTLGASSIFRLCEEVIALREMNNRQHKLFEQTLTKARDEMQRSFNSFAGDTQRPISSSARNCTAKSASVSLCSTNCSNWGPICSTLSPVVRPSTMPRR